MLKECRLALRITTEAYDAELCSLMEAAAQDLTIAGVRLPGRVSFSEETQGMNDHSSLKDPLCQRAVFTYVRAHFGSPADYDRLAESYEIQKAQLMHASDYTDYEDGGDPE